MKRLAAGMLVLSLVLSSCAGVRGVQDRSDQRALRRHFAIPRDVEMVSYQGFPAMAGFGQREGLEISAQYRLDADQAAAYRQQGLATDWQALPIPASIRSKILFQGLRVPLDAQEGIWVCRTAGNEVLRARDTRSCADVDILHDVIIGILDTSSNHLSVVIRAGY